MGYCFIYVQRNQQLSLFAHVCLFVVASPAYTYSTWTILSVTTRTEGSSGAQVVRFYLVKVTWQIPPPSSNIRSVCRHWRCQWRRDTYRASSPSPDVPDTVTAEGNSLLSTSNRVREHIGAPPEHRFELNGLTQYRQNNWFSVVWYHVIFESLFSDI